MEDRQGAASAAQLQHADVDKRLLSLVEDGKPLASSVAEMLSKGEPVRRGAITEMFQLPTFPSGCEIVSLCVALDAMGVNADPVEIADEHLTIDGDYKEGCIASPYEDSGGCLPPGLKKAGDSYLESKNIPLRCHDLTGSRFESLVALVEAGHPVLVWTTLYQEDPHFDENEDGWWIDEHCVVMYECSGGVVRVSDPLEGYVEHEKESFEHVFNACGRHALYIR